MKMKCLYSSIVRGDVVKQGQVIELSDAECAADVVKRNFVKVGDDAEVGSPASAPSASEIPAPKKVVARLTREQAVMKLRQAGVRVNGRLSDENLAKLYEQTFANVAEAASRADE